MADTVAAKRYMLTTADNPFNPFHKFDEWYRFDEDRGYQTSGLLDRIASTSDELSDADHHLALKQAIDEIIEEDVLGRYIRIFPES